MRFKIVACILILSVFSFVLAAPLPVLEVREACTDAVEREKDGTILSGKQAPRGNLHERGGSTDGSGSELGSPSPQSPAPDYASGGKSPLRSKVWSTTPDGAEVLWHPDGASQPGTTTENQPGSSSSAKKVQWASAPRKGQAIKWAPTIEIYTYPKDPLPLPPGRDGYMAKEAAKTLPKLKSKGVVGNVKSYLGKFGGKLKIRPRFQSTVDTAA
jgi:hypothetical protein